MVETSMVHARVESELKRKAEEVFSELGLSASDAITLFYEQVTLLGYMPFAVTTPNADTVAALRQARDGEGLTEYASLDELKAALN